MTTRVFRSTDSGAPVLNGQAGSLIALLNACLVGTAGVAYGTGSGAKAAAGWSRPYQAGAVAVYRNSLADGGLGCYLHVDDSSALHARVTVYRSMSDIDTGVAPAPSDAQISGGGYWIKSNAADTTLRPWAIAADARTFYLNPQVTPDGFGGDIVTKAYGAGDYDSTVPANGDAYFCLADLAGDWGVWPGPRSGVVATSPTSFNGLSLGGDTAVAVQLLVGATSGSGQDNFPIASPDAISGQILVAPAMLTRASHIAGSLRGAYVRYARAAEVGVMFAESGFVGVPGGTLLEVLCRYSVNASSFMVSAGDWP